MIIYNKEKVIMIEIRQENINDYEQVYDVVKTAFKTAQHSDGNEKYFAQILSINCQSA